ncbi:glycosyltransferase [Pararhodospirillum oryzae]|uniref:Glycosyltransferase 2-like domain-containing protein n=1 Tax=Pararhodospirillum oryzae TaxID=478448 RepID=A0A512HBS2_9PROT|nr:glycosyltransferase [Pararhodospirillum oryzae]GEO82840.1 hypothetical protein ROR02_29710 [Pararhodospirillum oryzae]
MIISLVTPSLNRASWIGAALQSVVEQKDDAIEILIIDGGSTDGTHDLVRQRFPQATLIIQPDRNLYEALNRGIERARGDVVGFLNTDDRLLPGALAAVRAGFARRTDSASVCGGCLLQTWDGPTTVQEQVLNHPAPKALRAGDIISGHILLNGRFFHRPVLEALSGFDDTYPTYADRDLLGRYHLAGYQTTVLDEVIYAYGCHAASLTFSGRASPTLLAEATLMARTRLHDSPSGAARRFYRRWHGWAAGYESARLAVTGEISKAWKTGRAALATDPLWPVFFAQHLGWHVGTRHERHT